MRQPPPDAPARRPTAPDLAARMRAALRGGTPATPEANPDQAPDRVAPPVRRGPRLIPNPTPSTVRSRLSRQRAKAATGPQDAPGVPGDPPEPGQSPPPAPGDQPEPVTDTQRAIVASESISLAYAADPTASSAPPAGALPRPEDTPVTLPPALAAPLSPRDMALVNRLVQGDNWGQALDALDVPPAARERSYTVPEPIRQAAEWMIVAVSARSGMSRAWIVAQCVSVYRRAVQAECVLTRKGEPTGVYRFDGTTAARMLDMLGSDIGMFGKQNKGIAPSDVADLLAEVARRGRPDLPGDRARVVDAERPAIAAPAATPGKSM